METAVDSESQVADMKSIIDDFFSIIPGMGKASSVAVLDASTLTEQEFRVRWVSTNTPCLIKGAIRHWPAVTSWKREDYWVSECDNFKVSAYLHMNHNDMNRQQLIEDKKTGFHEVIKRLFLNVDHTISVPGQEVTSGNRFSKVLKDLHGFSFLKNAKPPRTYERRRFFMYRRAATAWHYHVIDETLMCQINGSKRVGLLSPEIPKPKYVTAFLHDELHLKGEVLDTSLDLKPLVVDVEEGDALYIPPYWHHGVIPNDANIGFTLAYCWGSPWHKMGNFSNFFVRALYREAIWPFNKFTPFLPLLAFYAGISYLVRKIRE